MKWPQAVVGATLSVASFAAAGFLVTSIEQRSDARRTERHLLAEVEHRITVLRAEQETAKKTVTELEAELKRVAPPDLLSPLDGTVFSDSSWTKPSDPCGAPVADRLCRPTPLRWNAVPGAIGYEVEVDFGDGMTFRPLPTFVVEAPETRTSFVGAQPGRWRVRTILPGNGRGQWSEYWGFRWTM